MNTEPATIEQWLDYIERLHPQAIAMGLERVARVRDALKLEPTFPVIAVGGTNGKGSACAMLEAILSLAGYRVGCYTSPHLLRYNERVRIARREAGDAQLTAAFSAVNAARSEVPLTYFEFGTLVAAWLFAEEQVDVSILEVGLGGRLDAVNVFDADCALVMSIALDHMEYLGATREQIGYEKAGIFRQGRPAICADRDTPQTVRGHAAEIGARLLVLGADFGFSADETQWQYWGPHGKRNGLPHPALRGTYQLANASACLAALDALRDRLPVTMNDIRAGLLQAETPGRFQVLPGRPVVILDVAHNPHAAAALAENLGRMGRVRRTLAVFAMLRDKDIEGVIGATRARIDHWFVAGIAAPRGTDAERLVQALRAAGVTAAVTPCASIAAAYVQACDMATENDRILVFGSFYTVAAVMQARARGDAPQAS
ncbi:MAG: bifunctional folylpolyglutamate synthase/dihydrofolate synthase [Betaproteobacteria bacterium RIFCSPLOWO2_12_FULL_62_13]|nr:MAG: bifunctional folylpolyglutamate synthase/dihydrofolate synthase [Betaproteobacteria bacterium RIFCSPLOWO2_12_FULL_62_13]